MVKRWRCACAGLAPTPPSTFPSELLLKIREIKSRPSNRVSAAGAQLFPRCAAGGEVSTASGRMLRTAVTVTATAMATATTKQSAARPSSRSPCATQIQFRQVAVAVVASVIVVKVSRLAWIDRGITVRQCAMEDCGEKSC